MIELLLEPGVNTPTLDLLDWTWWHYWLEVISWAAAIIGVPAAIYTVIHQLGKHREALAAHHQAVTQLTNQMQTHQQAISTITERQATIAQDYERIAKELAKRDHPTIA